LRERAFFGRGAFRKKAEIFSETSGFEPTLEI
jgi:hypothetical protein